MTTAGRVRRLLTARLRLTLLLAALFLLCSIAVVAITYALVAQRPTAGVYVLNGSAPATYAGPSAMPRPSAPIPFDRLRDEIRRQDDAVQGRLLTRSSVAVAIVFVVSTMLSWIAAGRVLRPIRRMTASARRISARNLHERLTVDGPQDEIQELSQTFDALLDRLETAFEAQAHFAAHASHELRTPLATQRTTIEVALADRHLTVDRARELFVRLLEEQFEQEQLVSSLLLLADIAANVPLSDEVDLAVSVRRAVELLTDVARDAPVGITTELRPSRLRGNSQLIDALVLNGVKNAIVHNTADGRAAVRSWSDTLAVHLEITNTGPRTAEADVARLLRPFERNDARRGDGHGIGLAVMRAVVDAHRGRLSIAPLAEGGLRVHVTLPRRE